jgi:release factor glutamine methyltransferase
LPENLNIGAALQAATSHLRPVSESARLDAEILLARALDVERSYLYGHPEDCLDDAARRRFEVLIERRGDGVPLAYIMGEKEFWSMMLMVTPDTLVPRPETELLVQQALDRISLQDPMQILDLGTGSGAIALAIAKERPHCRVIATDSSADAIAVARQNARQLELGNVEFLQGNWTAAIRNEIFDLVLSNPPYVCSDDAALNDLGHEPRQALVSGADGLDDIRVLSADCGQLLSDGAELLLEHGAGQQQAVAQILAENGWIGIRHYNDLAGLPRVTSARRM